MKMNYAVVMVMEHLMVGQTVTLCEVTVGLSDTVSGASDIKRTIAMESCRPGHPVSNMRQLVYALNPQAGSVKTDFVLRAI